MKRLFKFSISAGSTAAIKDAFKKATLCFTIQTEVRNGGATPPLHQTSLWRPFPAHLQLLPRLRLMELYLYFTIPLYDMVFN
jgi:hypothetical protein